MKVLLVNHFPLEGSGSGIYTKNLALELKRQGHEVLVIVPDHVSTQDSDFTIKTIVFSNGGNDARLNFNFPCFTTHPKSNNTYYDLTDEQLEQYVEVFCSSVEEAVNEFQPDVIHCQHLWIAPYAASRLSIPYGITAHGTDLKGFVKDSRYHKYVLEGAQKAQFVITISQQVDQETGELYKVDKAKRILILNGFDENIFFPKNIDKTSVLKSLGIDRSYSYVVSFVGKLAEFKGVDVLLKAAKIYEEQLGDVATLIVGAGEKYQDLMQLKEKLQLKHVFFAGHKNQPQVADIYNIADVSVVPSRVEPFGLVAIEVLACGTTVVATNQGGLPDFIDDAIGHLVPVEDHESLARGIIKEVTHKQKPQRQKAAAVRALENFSWKRVLKEVLVVYEKAAK